MTADQDAIRLAHDLGGCEAAAVAAGNVLTPPPGTKHVKCTVFVKCVTCGETFERESFSVGGW